jgi:Ankyrin repeats (3 copies)
MKSLGITLLTWAALFGALWYGMRELYTPPGDWIGALIVSFFIAVGLGAIRKGRLERRDAALVARAEEAPRDGERIALVGTLAPLGEALRAPFSGAECVYYDYSISHIRQARRSGESSTNVVDRSGIALAPSSIRAGVRTIRLLAVPGIDRYSKTPVDEKLRDGARRYVAETAFEDTTGILALPEVGSLMGDSSGAVRKDWKLSEQDDAADGILEERFVPPGDRVCVIGHYDAKENAIVPEADVGGVRVIRGTRQEALSFLNDSRLGDLIAAALLIVVPALALWGVLTWREHYLSREKVAAAQREKQHDFAKAAAVGDVASVAQALRGGVDVNARDYQGDLVLASAPDARTAEALIAAGANVNAGGHDGLTPLMLAASNGRAEVVRVLIRHGAEVNAFNDAERGTALSLAVRNGHDDVARILREAGARELKK